MLLNNKNLQLVKLELNIYLKIKNNNFNFLNYKIFIFIEN